MPKSTPTTPPLDREAKRRLAVIRHVEEVSGIVAMSCRYFGISLPSTISNNTISHNTASSAAGGLYDTGSGQMTIIGTTITDNHVTDSRAGGVLVNPPTTVNAGTITNSTISGNTVRGFTPDYFSNRGGGLFLQTGQLTLSNTEVRDNQVIGEDSRGGGLAVNGDTPATMLTLVNGTTVTGNLALGRYSKGGGLYTDINGAGTVTVSVTGSHIDGNEVSGTGSAAGGVFNTGGTFSVAISSVNNNVAPNAPAPGGVYTDVAITSVDGATTFTGNTPTNCLLSPAPVTGCVN